MNINHELVHPGLGLGQEGALEEDLLRVQTTSAWARDPFFPFSKLWIYKEATTLKYGIGKYNNPQVHDRDATREPYTL